ncbi:hypothetical protein BKA64DRAFT_711194 [Cadophora sp. MPI-SDFR-AT-0126]|nr:hypothetical protein BKA64DRAFT_711194 [Leotiomycetes sp. MPI-SDFR-AT-0126]
MAPSKSPYSDKLRARLPMRWRSSSPASSSLAPADSLTHASTPDASASRSQIASEPGMITEKNPLGPSGIVSEESRSPGHATGHASDPTLHPSPVVTISTPASSSNVPGDNQAYRDAINKVVEKLDESEKEAFRQAYQQISPERTLDTIRRLDSSDEASRTRSGAKALEPAMKIIETSMRSVAISIQHSPEISSLVVGGVRLIIDLVAKFIHFYNRLSQMICQMAEHIKIFQELGKLSNGTIVHEALVDVYRDFLTFCVQSRRVFVDHDGAEKKFGHFRTFCRVQWQPFEDKFGDIEANFTHHVNILRMAAQAQHLGASYSQQEAIRNGFDKAEGERKRIQTREQIEERKQFLEWVSDIDYEATFDEIIKKKHPGTGEWLLTHRTFKYWVNNPAASLLWCHGKPGAGKSVLSSIVLDHISNLELEDPETCVIFAYYSYQTPERHSLAKLLGSLIRQLACKLKELPEDILKFFQTCYRDAKSPRSYDLEIYFFNLLRKFPSQAIIVFDGLDECESSSREDVLAFIARLAKEQSSLVKVFVTSRRDEDIKDTFDGCPVVEIDSELVNDDIKVFLRDEIERRIQDKKLKLRNLDLKDAILDAISSKSNGMFLWAKLQLDLVCEERRDSDIIKALEFLPRDLYATYDRILQKIDKKTPALRELARKTLMWIIYAKRPLNVEELVDALAIQEGMTQYQELRDLFYDEESILSSCEGLISIVESDYDDYHLHPIHYSVLEYLKSTALEPRSPQTLREKYFTDVNIAHCEIANSCIDFMQLDIFATGPSPHERSLLRRAHDSPLAFYSTYYFDKHLEHLKLIPPELRLKIDALLGCDTKRLAAILQCRRCHGESDKAYQEFDKLNFPVNATTMLISTSLFNRPEFDHLSPDWSKDSLPRYTLHQAALSNSDTAVARLLDLGIVDVNEEDEDGITPLMHAARSGFHTIVHRLIVDGQADVNIGNCTNDHYTALSSACDFGHLSVVRLLIENGAIISVDDVFRACGDYCKDDAVLEMLLNHGALATSSALEKAANNGFTSRCSILLDHGARVTAKALEIAFNYQGRGSAVATLLEKHSTPEILSEAEVFWASSYFCKDDSVLENLLANGAAATSKALEAAAELSSTKCCTLLLEHGALVIADVLVASWRWDTSKDRDTARLLEKHSTPEIIAEAEDLYRQRYDWPPSRGT